MNKEKDDFSKDVESIFRKSVEINKDYLKQSNELAKNFGSSGGDLKSFKLFKPEVMLGALTSFTKMNLDHYKNMMDLGFALTKKALTPNAEDESPKDADPEKPSFILSATSYAGENVDLQFLLDNVKKEEVSCQLVNSEYVNLDNTDNIQNFLTVFRPQSFQLAAGVSQTVAIIITIDDNVPSGTYQSKVQVLGFEPAFFLIKLTIADKEKEPEKTVKPSPKKKSANGRQNEKRPEQQ